MSEVNDNSIGALRDILWEQIRSLQEKPGAKPIDRERIGLTIKAADGIINTYKVQLAYQALLKKTGGIPELESGKTIALEGPNATNGAGPETNTGANLEVAAGEPRTGESDKPQVEKGLGEEVS